REDLKDDALQHRSGNPYDFMNDELYKQCTLAVRGQENKLDENTKRAILHNIPRVLAKVVHVGCPLEKQKKWVKHAIRSALKSADKPMSGLAATMPMKKPGYDWFIAILTREAYDVLKDLRALFDPRSNTLVLLRQWKLRPDATQTLRYEGIVTKEDFIEGEIEAVTNNFKDELEEELKKGAELGGIQLTKIVHLKKEPPTSTLVTFSISGAHVPQLIQPWNLPKKFIVGQATRRDIRAYWPAKCNLCHSEGHLEAEVCPWTKLDLGKDAKISTTNAKILEPGQQERKKRKREGDDEPITSWLEDARPIKRMKKATGKEKEQNLTGADTENGDRMATD
ncbi:11593_t:CDS:1, partial [Acaulospora colombiana]